MRDIVVAVLVLTTACVPRVPSVGNVPMTTAAYYGCGDVSVLEAEAKNDNLPVEAGDDICVVLGRYGEPIGTAYDQHVGYAFMTASYGHIGRAWNFYRGFRVTFQKVTDPKLAKAMQRSPDQLGRFVVQSVSY